MIGLPADARRGKFARDVAAGLAAAPKHLPCCYFYDRLGSLLFEAICETPEYYLTRTETGILRREADAIAGQFAEAVDVIELGSGTAVKTRLLIDAFRRRGVALRYVPIDICRTVLEESSQALLSDYPELEVVAVAGEYQEGLAYLGEKNRRVAKNPTPPAERAPAAKLILWLGSNIGNLDREPAARFLAQVRATMTPGDRLLVGIDLRKERALLEAAYDDACGVTAAFNRNLLVRINRELGGDFDAAAFRHRAVYDENLGRVEMHLVSERAQRVRIPQAGLEAAFASGEGIHTENAYKYSTAEIEALAGAAGLRIEHAWMDAEGRFRLVQFATGS